MSTHISTRFSVRWSKRSGTQLFIGSMVASLVALSFVAGMEVSVATARMGAERSTQIVNRAQKADRLWAMPAFQLKAVKLRREVIVPNLPAVDFKLPDGCEPLVSPVADDRLARAAGRCVS